MIWANNDAQVDIVWEKPVLPQEVIFKLKLIADWKKPRCKLTYFYEGKKLNDKNDECTLLLPDLNYGDVWYPCVSPMNKDAYCIIRYT